METGCADSVLERIRTMLVEDFGADREAVSLETSFRGSLDLDSMDSAQLILNLEELFGIEIPEDDAQKMFTVGDAVRYAEERL